MNIDLLYIKFLSQSQKITTDTRKIESGQLFFALKGSNFDGNKYAIEALNQGAKYAIIDDKSIYGLHPNLILVDDVLKTLQELALYHRRKLNIPIIAITGSNGKTTTKELIKEVLSKKYRVAYTKGNLNNHIGIPLTLLDIKANDEIAIVEMGANHIGEIASYCLYTEPNYCLITNIGKAHLEGFGSIEGVLKGKTELFEYIKKNNGIAFVNKDDIQLKTKSENIKCIYYSKLDLTNNISGKILPSEKYLNICISIENELLEINTNLAGIYNFYNVLAAYTIGHFFEVPNNEIKLAIENYIPTNSRSQLIKRESNTIILDAYNANPSSMDVAITNLCSIEGQKIAILGAMKEMGEFSKKEHQLLVENCINSSISIIAFVGKEFEFIEPSARIKYFETTEEAKDWFLMSYFKDSTILIKGSRSMTLEKIIE